MRFAPLTAVALLAAGVLLVRYGPHRQALAGTDLGGAPAPGFSLTDQNGQAVSLADLRGKAVVLTFLYTSCPDVCPLTTVKFQRAIRQLGPDAQRIAFVAVTVDPETDTPQRLQQYTRAMGMSGRLTFLTGSRAQLEPVWKAYYVQPLSAQQAAKLIAEGPAAPSDPTFQNAHTAPVFLLDPQGREQRLLGPDFTVAALVADLRRLAR
jgi:protein SCO1/2